MKVLFCTDGSDISYSAIRKTLPFLHKTDEINILNIIETEFFSYPTNSKINGEEEKFVLKEKQLAQKILDKTTEIIESEGFLVTKTGYFQGTPAEKILEISNKENYDLLVLGSHGKKGIKKWLGNVSRKIVTKSETPILVVSPPLKKEIDFVEKRVVFAVDGSECSFEAVRRTLSLLNLEDSYIEIISVKKGIEELPVEIISDKEWTENIIKKEDKFTEEVLEKTKSIFREYNIPFQSAFSLKGDPAKTLLTYLDREEADLIVMGSHGREGFSDFLLGSVSKRVLDHAKNSVLIVPKKKKHYI